MFPAWCSLSYPFKQDSKAVEQLSREFNMVNVADDEDDGEAGVRQAILLELFLHLQKLDCCCMLRSHSVQMESTSLAFYLQTNLARLVGPLQHLNDLRAAPKWLVGNPESFFLPQLHPDIINTEGIEKFKYYFTSSNEVWHQGLLLWAS